MKRRLEPPTQTPGAPWPSARRHEKRAEIPWHVRQAVFKRDDYRCCFCGTQTTDLHLDHIIPWSAGGTDHSDNLRALCASCNLTKTNTYYPEDLRRELPVAAGCLECSPDLHAGAPTLAYCRSCGCTSYSDAIDSGPLRRARGTSIQDTPCWYGVSDPSRQPGSDYQAPTWRQVRHLVVGGSPW
jgi:hypothetical protein